MTPTPVGSYRANDTKEQPLLVRIVLALGALPLKVRTALGASAGFLFALLPTRDQRIAALQINRFLPRTESALPLVRQVYAEAGRNALGALNLLPLLDTIDCSDSIILERLKTERRPVLALTAHLGPWDLLGAWLISQGIPVATIGRKARNPTLQKILTTIRARYGITTIWRDEERGMRRIIKYLRGGGLLAALIDQDTVVSSTSVPFFGHPARTPSGLVELAQRCNALVVLTFIYRTPNGRHTIELKAVPEHADAEEVLQTYSARLEELIRAYPAQWVWFHKRWRTRADGTRMSGEEYAAWLTEAGHVRGDNVSVGHRI
jgi:KDO2-lipid IV(A) lauroyltransferase